MVDTTLPISNKGTNGSPITDANNNALQGVEVRLYRLKTNDTNSDGEPDEITGSELLSRTQTDSNGEFAFTENDLPVTYISGNPEKVYYCALRADYLNSGSGDPLDNGRFSVLDATNEPDATDYLVAYSLKESIIDDFEDGDMSEYGVTLNNVQTVQSPVLFGSYSAKISGNAKAASTSGLEYYPSQGDKFSFYAYNPSSTADVNEMVTFGLQDENNFYGASFSRSNNLIRLFKDGDTGNEIVAEVSVSLSLDTWYEMEVEWYTNGDITLIVYEVDQSTGSRQSQIGSLTHNDTTYTSGGIGLYAVGSLGTAQIDNIARTGGV